MPDSTPPHGDENGHEPTDGYKGPADITVGEQHATVEVELSGHFDSIVGRHVWRGRLREFGGALTPGTPSGPGTEVTLRIQAGDGRTATATGRITEIDLWGSHMIDGISAPPY
ncbi:DUF4873 domain-containing protein [Rhodococcus sp. HNM0563]|uniref:DUF4873 domain-containing protein n=1 Tax=Rhodococcus sp. HNM0563 TaxID=2716339 RepID=UPI00146E2D4D|nr:DUF4873 domain-containing protein [Rhodococcus sp. HNM0563]NLU64695.1 DUF4873 domain-containing protein [Rhodococcus sp. HNM0563]